MKALLPVLGAGILLTGCATPQPIVNTASLVAEMSGDMDRSVNAYVASLKAARTADAKRLQGRDTQAALRKRVVQEDLQMMKFGENSRMPKAMTDLDTMLAPAANPLRQVAGESSVAAKAVSFDGAPLKNVATIASEIARPPTASEQFAALLVFANTVNDDLLKDAEDNKNVKASP